jgi:hypothetical protein
MSQPATINILITRNAKLIQNYFGLQTQFLAKSVSFSNLVDDAKEDRKTILYSTSNSKNIIRLEHSTLEDSENQGVLKGLITVEIVDPDSKFEEDFVRMDITQVFRDFIKSEVQSSFSEENDSAFRSYITNSILSSTIGNETFYITYGTGDNLSTWAGPFICKFSDAQVRYSGTDQRKLILYFVDARSPFSCSMGIYGENLPLTLYRSNYFASVTHKINSAEPTTLDYSEIIYSLYEDYLNQIYAEQASVIVLLPEVKSFFLQQIRGIIKKNLVETKKPSIHTRSMPIFSKWERDYNLRSVKLDALAAEKSAVSDILEEFGIQLVADGDAVKKDIKKLVAGVREARAEYLFSANPKEYWAILRADLVQNYWREYYAPIKKLRDLLARFGFDIVFYEETNVKVLKIWKDAKIIKDDTKPAVILGDINLVNQFLYGGYDLQTAVPGTPNFNIGSIKAGKQIPFSFLDGAITLKPGSYLGGFIEVKDSPFGYDNEFNYDQDLDENNERRKNLFGPKYYLRQSDLIKYFTNSNLSSKFSKLTKTYTYEYGELEKTGIVTLDKKLTEIDLRRGKTGNFPIFRFNIPNPNVVKLDLDSKNSYYTALFATVQRMVYDYPSRYVDSKIKLGGLAEPDKSIYNHIIEIANKFIKTGKEELNVDEAKKLILPYINKSSLTKDSEDIVATKWGLFLAEYVKERQRKMSPILELSDWDGSELLGLKKTFSDLMRQINTIKIRTLPMFQISKRSDLLSVAYLLADTVDVYGFSETIMSEVLSNEYRILGFKHHVTLEECYSEFTLALDPNTPGTKKLMSG